MHFMVTCHMLCQSYCITLADLTDKPQSDGTMQHIIEEIRKKKSMMKKDAMKILLNCSLFACLILWTDEHSVNHVQEALQCYLNLSVWEAGKSVIMCVRWRLDLQSFKKLCFHIVSYICAGLTCTGELFMLLQIYHTSSFCSQHFTQDSLS